MSPIIATKAFFKILFNRETANRYQQLESAPALPAPSTESKPKEKPAPKPAPKPKRSEAITLLAALQREARLIDITQEPLADYSDEQIGAAARDVLRDTAKVIERMFDIQPMTDTQEGDSLETPADFDSGRYHLTGNVAGDPPFKGAVAHHGWEAKKCDVPQWNGKDSSAKVIAPIEIEIA